MISLNSAIAGIGTESEKRKARNGKRETGNEKWEMRKWKMGNGNDLEVQGQGPFSLNRNL